MGGFKFEGRITSFLFFLAVMNVIFLMEDLEGASASINNPKISCNGTIGDCFFVNEGEFGEFQRYVVGGRWLLQTSNRIPYNALQQPAVCGTPQYSNCIVQINAQTRPCTDYNRCKRAG